MMDTLKSSRFLPGLVIALTGIVAHLFWLQVVALQPEPGGDSGFYLAMAANLRDYGVYGTGETAQFYRPPLYSAFIWAVSLFSDNVVDAVIVAQSALSILTAVACFEMMRRESFGTAFAWTMTWVALPFVSLTSFLLLQEMLYANLILLVCVYLYTRVHRFGWRQAVVSGVLMALVVYTRDVFLLMPVALYFAVIVVRGFGALRSVALGLAVFVTCLMPWMLRNASMDEGGLFMSQGIVGRSLYIGTWYGDGGSQWNSEWWQTGQNLPDYAFETEADRERVERAYRNRDNDALKDEAISRILADPVGVAQTWVMRSRAMWIGTRSDLNTLAFADGSNLWYVSKVFFAALNAVIVGVGLIGMILYGFRNKSFIFVCFIAYNYFVYLPFLNIETRYSHPSLLLLLFFAIHVVQRFLPRKRRLDPAPEPAR